MRKLSLLLLFIITMLFISQLEKFQSAASSLLANGIPPTVYLAMILSLVCFILLWFSSLYIRKLKKLANH